MVRNAVAILGELRDQEAAAGLKPLLKHKDVRVRRETIRSLTKIGGQSTASNSFSKGLSTTDLAVLATLLDGTALKGAAFAVELKARGIDHIHAVAARTSDGESVVSAPRKVYSTRR